MKELVTIIFLFISVLSHAQIDKNSDLFKTLQVQDSTFFERGFNQCDLDFLQNHIADNLKFYHDQSGFQDRKAFFENTKKYICSNSAKKPIRNIDANSLEAFPLYNDGNLYGAIQKGTHHFYLRENGKEDVWTSTAKFTHVWVLENKTWKLSEVLSYDHQDPVSDQPRNNSIEQLLKENNVPALGIGIIENGKLTKVEVYGTLDKQTTAPYNTIFKVASLTKPVVALTALKLIDKGMLDMDEPLYRYWIDPDIKGDKRHKKLTPRMILTHRTGFPNWRYMTEANKLAFQFEPGAKYQYSGEGFEYLRKAIESKLGKSIETLSQELIFTSSGMNDTRFWWDSTMDESRYAQNFDGNGNKISTAKYYEANAAANLLTTVEDYGKFLAYVINGAELSESLFQEMQKHQVELKVNDYFGLGWEILTGFSNDEYALLHTGKDPGVSTLAIMFPKSKNGYLIFLNGDNVDKVYEYILTKELYLGDELWNRR
ncbi:class A beta-lactamase-related serine hydrolase [Pontibacter sp. E15-1]|uniref:class A beta-lactamase-related serine hydrolase n=1 Tax=Pontibacter sp. E15-1 TaxID=2919918 RepID=UPI001F4FB5B0|nr:class A beta-lactamase-related serine hydrolase [Pontibacter sp. E15-1]MCJ8165406.1 class A beta-lactamase-related serine hydrolase [Pontibacter sp. E15-1]